MLIQNSQFQKIYQVVILNIFIHIGAQLPYLQSFLFCPSLNFFMLIAGKVFWGVLRQSLTFFHHRNGYFLQHVEKCQGHDRHETKKCTLKRL